MYMDSYQNFENGIAKTKLSDYTDFMIGITTYLLPLC
jgi:hypothetical protein